MALLRTALNERGLDQVLAVMALEITLRQLKAFGFSRDPGTMRSRFMEPGVGGWGWRISSPIQRFPPPYARTAVHELVMRYAVLQTTRICISIRGVVGM